MHSQDRLRFIGLWLLMSTLAALSCAAFWGAAHLDDELLPVSIDSFYHARRILDTVADPSAFYEFDPRIHAPEGSLLTWPWGYDFGMAMLVKVGVIMGLASDPMQILIWLPVAAVFISVGLLMLIARRLQLSTWSTAIATLCMALSPLTELLHGVGIIDHHFAEYIFVLATLAFGLKWLALPDDKSAAVTLGVILGVAPAVHNGLFVLQLPLLACAFAFWLQQRQLPARTVAWFGGALLLSTLTILLPSLPFRLGHFEFYTLSWFHLYVAAGTAIAMFALSRLPRDVRGFAALAAIALVLLIPLARQFITAQAFLAGTIIRLDAITEMRSIRQMATSRGPQFISTLYSAFIWLMPLTLGLCVYRAWVDRNSARLFFWLSGIGGLVMLAMQFRLHYFGSFALYLPWLVLGEDFVARWPTRRRQIMLAATLGFVLAYWMPVRFYLLGPPPLPAADESFAKLHPILKTLKEACAKDPGIVLSDNDAGHYIRYYTECSVIANNFLLTRQHEEKIRQIDYLTSLSADELPTVAPYVRYVLLRPVNVVDTGNNTVTYTSYSPKSAPLVDQLLLKPVAGVPANYVLLNQASLVDTRTHESLPYIRLYKVVPSR
jgi:hypothetical protein